MVQELVCRKEEYGMGSSTIQYDAPWIADYRKAVSFDFLGMLSPTNFIASSDDQAKWMRLFPQRNDPVTQQALESLLARGKQRELLAALAEKRAPEFVYPALLVEEVQSYRKQLLDLEARIVLHEANEVVRHLYVGDQGAIPYMLHHLDLLEAVARGESEAFWRHITTIYPAPTIQEMSYTLSRVKWFIKRGLTQKHTKGVSQQLITLLEEQLSLRISDLPDTEELHLGLELDVSLYGKPVSVSQRELSPETVSKLFVALFREQNCTDWNAVIDYAAQHTRIDASLRRCIVAGVPYTFNQIIQQVAHEWGAHIAPRVKGERSSLGLLGIGTGWSLATEEGVAAYLEWELAKRLGQRFDESKLWIGTLATGLAAGVLVPPQTFFGLYQFFETFLILYRMVWRGDEDEATVFSRANSLARTRCLRTYRGVPSGSRTGICFTKDAVYARGFLQVYDAVQQDQTVLDWLAAGSMTIGQIPDLRMLGIEPAHSSRSLLERPDLEAYILSLDKRNLSGDQ